jgi:RNA polymerase sigma factor (sigma-70 family)
MRKRRPVTYAITTGGESSDKTKGYDLPPRKVARQRLSALPARPAPQPRNSPYLIEQEDVLIARARLGDRVAGNMLLLAYDKLLCREAKNWFFSLRGHDLELDDLVQVARMGLMHALHKFDRSKGTFGAYVTVWVMQHCVRIIQNEGFAIRVPVHKHQALSSFERNQTGEAMPEPLYEAMAAKRPTRLDEPLRNAEFTTRDTRADLLRSSAMCADDVYLQNQYQRVVREVVGELRVGLSKLDRAVIDRRLLADEPDDMATIGRDNDRSRERVRQREAVLKTRLSRALRQRFVAADVL